MQHYFSAKRKWILLVVCFVQHYTFCSAQQSAFSGVVTIHNSFFETGVKRFVSNAQVQDDFDRAQPTTTDGNGNFKLVYVGVGEKQTVSFQVKHTGYEVVNISELNAVTGQVSPVKISLALPGKIAEYRKQIYNVGKTEADKQLAKLLSARNKELETAKKEITQDKLLINKLEDEINKLRSSNLLIEQQARELAKRYERINLDDASLYYQQAFRFFQDGNLDSALHILNIDYDKLITQYLQEEKSITNSQAELDKRKAAQSLLKENALKTLGLKKDLHNTRFQFDSVAVCFERMIKIDSDNAKLWFENAVFLSRIQNDSTAIEAFGNVLRLTKNDSLIAVSKTELGIIYQSRNQFTRAEKLFNESLEIQKRLYSSDSTKYGSSLTRTQTKLGYFYMSTNEFSRADSAMKQALQIQMSANLSLPENQTNISDIYNGLGNLARSSNNFKDAETSLLRSIGVLRENIAKDPGKAEKNLVATICSLGALYSEGGEFEKAKITFKEAEELTARLVALNSDVYQPSYALLLFQTAFFDMLCRRDSAGLLKLKTCVSILNKLVKKDPDLFEINLAVSKEFLGRYYLNNRQPDSAALIFNEIIGVYRRNAIKNPQVYEGYIAYNRQLLAMAEINRMKYNDADALLDEAILIYKKLYNANREPYKLSLGNALYTKGTLFQNKNQADSARSYYNAAINLYDSVTQKNAMITGNLVNANFNLGMIASYTGNNQDAIKYLSLAKNSQYSLVKFSDSIYEPFLVTIQFNLGVAYSRGDDMLRAKNELEKAELMQKKLVTRHNDAIPFLVSIKYELSRINWNLNELAAAELYLNDALAMQRTLVSSNNNFEPFLVTLINSMAYLYKFKSDNSAAITAYKEAILIQRKLVLKDTIYRSFLAQLLLSLGDVYSQKNDVDSAYIIMSDALQIQKMLTRTDFRQKPFLATIMSNLGKLEAGLNRLANAETKFLDAIAIVQELDTSLGFIKSQLLGLQSGLCWVYTLQKEYNKAELLMKRIISQQLDLVIRNPEYEEPNLVNYYFSLALVFRDLKLFDSALDYLNKAAIIQERLVKKNASFKSYLANIYFNTAMLYNSKTDVPDAEKFVQQAIEVQLELPETEANQFFLQQLYTFYYNLLNSHNDSRAFLIRFKASRIQKKLALANDKFQQLVFQSLYDDGLANERKSLYFNAERKYVEAFSLQRDYGRKYPVDSSFLVDIYLALQRVYKLQYNYRSADSITDLAIKNVKSLIGKDSMLYESKLLTLYFEKGQLHKFDPDINKTKEAFFSALGIQQKMVERDSVLYQPFLIAIYDEIAMLYGRNNQPDSGIYFISIVLDRLERLFKTNPKFRNFSVNFYLNASYLYSGKKEFQRAQFCIETALAIQLPLVTQNRMDNIRDLIRIERDYGEVLKNQHLGTKAIDMYLQAIEHQKELERNFSQTNTVLSYLYFDIGIAYKQNNEKNTATVYFKNALKAYQQLPMPDPVLLGRIRNELEELK